MARTSMVILEEDYTRFTDLLESVLEETNARFVFLIDKTGQQLAHAGELEGADLTALASLTAGNVAATEGLAQLIGEDEFSTLFHEGSKDSLHISLVSTKIILLVIFDEHSSLGLVRLRVKQRASELGTVVDEILGRSGSGSGKAIGAAAFADITDEDIDALFG
jgi:predicted regulator of Ras-like GTPase activity (Roadblock/LC7/MglB family)